MSLTDKQRGVFKGIVLGGLAALFIVGIGSYLNPFGFTKPISLIDRLSVVAMSWLVPAFFIAISIGRLARYRFFSPEDIDGGGLSEGSEQAKVLQSLLQNTIEQALVALPVYAAWSVLLPSTWLSTVPIAAIAFGLGRILFFAGYTRGAPSRAIGFTLSFYPSLIMLVVIIGTLAWRVIS